jgi:biotin transport system ATP-binding protein
MIEVKAVCHRIGDRQILKHITLTLTEQRIGIVGSNGSGKSSFIRLLNGLLLPAQGDVWIDGLNTRTQAKAIRRRVGFVFQNPDHQIVFPLVEEDLAFGLKQLKLSKTEIAQAVDAILQQYQLAHLRYQPTHLLSGGEKQLLAIAAVVVMNPAIILFDEPTTLLDLRNRNRIQQVLAELPQTIVVVSHDLELLRSFDRVLVFEAGELIMDDRPSVALPFYVQLMS